MIEEEYRYRAS